MPQKFSDINELLQDSLAIDMGTFIQLKRLEDQIKHITTNHPSIRSGAEEISEITAALSLNLLKSLLLGTQSWV